MRENENQPNLNETRLDETQIVSMADLEELERLQLAGSGQAASKEAGLRPGGVPLGVLVGILAALLVAGLAAGVLLHHPAPAPAGQTAPGGRR